MSTKRGKLVERSLRKRLLADFLPRGGKRACAGNASFFELQSAALVEFLAASRLSGLFRQLQNGNELPHFKCDARAHCILQEQLLCGIGRGVRAPSQADYFPAGVNQTEGNHDHTIAKLE